MTRSHVMKPGLTAVVTGASTGIGRAFAIMLARKYKAKLLLNARSRETLDATAAQVSQAGGTVSCVYGDVANPEVTKEVISRTLEQFGEPDLLVNNAGFARPGPMTEITPEDWRAVFEVNFFAPLNLIYAVLPGFLQRRQGTIINIASVAGKIAFPGSVCYAASKFALTGMSEGMAAELAGRGVDIITVCPGLVRTEFFRKNNNPMDITAMAEKQDLTGWVMRNIVSISSEQAALDILKACEKGGSHEIVLTGPGIFLERLQGICPPAAFQLSKLVPSNRRGKSATTQ